MQEATPRVYRQVIERMARAMARADADEAAKFGFYLDVEIEWPEYIRQAEVALKVIHDIGV